ncbi:MAG: hypothetical protein ACREBD_04145 [Blastocatellia bacterium]
MPLQINPGQQRSAQNAEIKNYTLVGNKGWLTVCKILVCILLAGWNAHLFVRTIPGWMGIFTAFVAISVEITALYCVHNFTRSVDEHKLWLGRFAVVLGVFSLMHAVLAIVDYTGYAGADVGRVINFYSHVVALPAIVILLSVTTATLSMKHWSAEVIRDLATSKLDSLRNRARVLMEQHRLFDAQELSQLKAELFDQETGLKIALIPIVERRIRASEQLEQMIEKIEDPTVKREIRRDFDALTSRLPAPLPTTTTPPPLSPHARPSILGQAFTANGGNLNGHPW